MLVLKCVENRSAMPVPAKGRCAMSVSKKFCRAEYDNLIAWLAAESSGIPSRRGIMAFLVRTKCSYFRF